MKSWESGVSSESVEDGSLRVSLPLSALLETSLSSFICNVPEVTLPSADISKVFKTTLHSLVRILLNLVTTFAVVLSKFTTLLSLEVLSGACGAGSFTGPAVFDSKFEDGCGSISELVTGAAASVPSTSPCGCVDAVSAVLGASA